MFEAWSQRSARERSGALPRAATALSGPQEAAKEGVHGGTMGSPVLDQVEPRRLFIEQNAKDVRFLDV